MGSHQHVLLLHSALRGWATINTYYGGVGFRVEMIRTDKINSMLKSAGVKTVLKTAGSFLSRSSSIRHPTSPIQHRQLYQEVLRGGKPDKSRLGQLHSRLRLLPTAVCLRMVHNPNGPCLSINVEACFDLLYSSEPVRTLIFCNSKRTVIYIYLPASPAQGGVSFSPRRGFLFPKARSSSSPETPDSSNATSKLAGRPTAVTVYDYCPKTYNVRIQCRTSPLLIFGLPHS
jgi:hypothetical protein